MQHQILESMKGKLSLLPVIRMQTGHSLFPVHRRATKNRESGSLRILKEQSFLPVLNQPYDRQVLLNHVRLFAAP